MAKIPAGEDFGNVVARGPRYNEQQVPQAAFGTPIAEAATHGGAFLVSEERHQKALADAADRAQAAAHMREIEADLQVITEDVSQGVRTGQIEKGQAQQEFQRRAQERIATGMESIPTPFQSIAQQDANTKATRMTRYVTRAVMQRDQQDVRTGIQQQLEYAQRLYLTDPASADQIASETIKKMGEFSGLDQAALDRVHQSWTEGTRLNKATTLITDARRNNTALDNVTKQLDTPEFNALDPQRKSNLLAQIEGYKVANSQKAESDARRAQAEEERKLRLAESQFNAAQSIITQGKNLSQEYVDQVTKAVAGTPYEAALKETLRQAPERSSFGVQSLAVQQQTLIAARTELNRTGTNPATEKRVAELQRIHDAAVRDYKEEPLQAALDRGVIQQIPPIDTSSLAGLMQTVMQRVDAAGITRQQTGAPVSPLLKQEAEQVGRMLNILPVDQRATAVAHLAQAVGPEQASAMGRQMAPKDKALGIALGMAGAKTTAGRYTSELVLRGAQAMKDKAVQQDNKALTGIRAQVAKEIGDAYLNQDLRETMIDAAVLAEYGLQAEGGSDVRRAVNLVTGGITEHAGRKLPLPYGIKAEEFDRRLRALTPQDLHTEDVLIGGAKVPAAQFLQSLPDAPLIHAGQGRYAVQAGSSLVQRPDGRPLILEFR